MQQSAKSSGTTRSEEILAALCERAFLPLWCCANPHRTTAKELCDVLVVFGDDVLLFSDKDCAFPSTGKTELDWARWSRRAIADSVRQLHGAVRHLQRAPGEVYVDAKCEKPLPVKVSERSRFHKIVVARGAKDACKRYFGEGSGSLMTFVPNSLNKPFCVDAIFDGDIVHVLDEVTLPILLRELDTAQDFLGYLNAKADLLRSGPTFSVFGEEELLGLFLKSGLQRGHLRAFPSFPRKHDHIGIDEGHWEEVRLSARYAEAKRSQEVSYLWDSMLGSFGMALERGTAPNPLNQSFDTLERLGRFLATEDRYGRTLLSRAIVERLETTPPGAVGTRVLRSTTGQRSLVYAIAIMSSEQFASVEEYRAFQREYIFGYALNVLEQHPKVEWIVGLATDANNPAGANFDFCLFPQHTLTAFEREWVDEGRVEYGWSPKLRLARPVDARKRRARNAAKRARRGTRR